MKHNTFINRISFYSTCLRGIYLLFLVLFSFSTLCLRSQSIGNWTFNGTLTGTPGLFNSASVADFSSGVPTHSFNGGSEYFGENGWPSGALNTGMYLQFTLAPSAGYQLDISTLVIRLRRSNTGSPAGSGPTAWALRSSLDGFATNIASGTNTHNYADYTITPGAAFTNLYTAVTFRLYGYNTSVSSGGNSRLVVDNLRVNGIGYLLPARLGTPSCAVINQQARLSFTVYHTENNNQYIIERSADGIHFSAVKTIAETSSSAEKEYVYTDDISGITSSNKMYYRIRMTGSNGVSVFSSVVAIIIKNNEAVLHTSTRNNQLFINGIFASPGVYHAIIYNFNGQVIARNTFEAIKGYQAFTFNINTPLPAGCIIHIAGNNGYTSAAVSAAPY